MSIQRHDGANLKAEQLSSAKRARPQLLLPLLLIAAAFPVRFASSGGTVSAFDVALALLALPLLVLLGIRGMPAVPSQIWTLSMASIFFSILSMAWSQDSIATVAYIISSVESLVVFLLVTVLLKDAPSSQVVRLIGTFVLLLLVPSALLWLRVPGFLPPAELIETSGDYISYFARLSHPFIGRSNNLAALLVIFVVPLAVWGYRRRSVFAGVASLAAVGAVVLTLSRGTLAALIASLLLFVLVDFAAFRGLVRKWFFPFIAVVAVVGMIFSLNESAAEYFGSRLTSAGLDARGYLADDALRSVWDHWVFGIGAGVGVDAHNAFLQQFVYLGIFLGAIMTLLLIRIPALWFHASNDAMRWADIAIGVGFAAQFGSFLSQSSYEGTLLRPLIWLGWGLLFALRNSYKAENSELMSSQRSQFSNVDKRKRG